MRKIRSNGPEQTFAIGKAIGETAKRGEVYALAGDLGAGKTVFAKGVAAGLGVGEEVNSPTFTILQVYESGRLPFYHFDVYRIEDPGEMQEVGLDEYLAGDGVCLIEWPERIDELRPAGVRIIRIERDPEGGDDDRTITMEELP